MSPFPPIAACLVLLLSLGAPYCLGDNMLFERMGQSSQVKQFGLLPAIAQDPDGFMWFGGPDGLTRFDGIEFKVYEGDTVDPKNQCGRFVQSLFVDSAKVLWVGTEHGFCRYNRQLDKFSPFEGAGLPPIIRGGPVLEDPKGNLYLGIRNGLLVLDKTRQKIKHYLLPIAPTGANSATDIQSLFIDSRQRVWVGTSDSGLAEFDLSSSQFKFFKNDSRTRHTITSNNIQNITEGENGNLWLAFYESGVDLFNPDQGISRHYDIDNTNNKISAFRAIKDSEHNVWITSDGAGLLHYQAEQDKFEHQLHDDGIDTSLLTNKTVGVFEDHNQGLWVTTAPYGIHYYEASSRQIRNYQKSQQMPSLNDNGILCFYERRDGTILVGTEKGVNIYNPGNQTISPFTDSQIPIPSWPITHITEDNQGNTWIGTWGHGLYRVAAQDKSVTQFTKNNQPNSLTSNIIWRILANPDNSLWLATQGGGLLHFNPTTEDFKQFTSISDEVSISNHHLNDLMRDNQGRLWIAGYGGVHRLGTNGRLTQIPLTTLPSTRIRSLLQDKKGRVWIATEDAGIFIWEDDKTQLINLDVADGLIYSFVTRIEQDAQQTIWAATLRGLVAIDPETLKIKPISKIFSIAANKIYRGALLASRASGLYVGSIEGFSRFNSAEMRETNNQFPIFITGIVVNNKPLSPTNNADVLSTNISFAKELQLNYQHGSFSFKFAALNYHMLDLNHYLYKLEGFDKDWNDTAGQNLVTYTNIPPGNYHFKVQAANGSGTYSSQEVDLAVFIAPPPWKTWWAYLLYATLLLAVIYQTYRQQRDKIEFDKEKRLNLELLRVNRIKDEFLANTTHELRTPINGMIGLTLAIQDEIQNKNPGLKEKFDLIVSSGRRLSHLIDDILDYAKMADADIVLHKSWVDIHPLVERVFSIASPLAKNKNLLLLNDTQESDGRIFVDPNRIEQIVLNLVSNAIKYTDSGMVKVFICPEADKFTLVIQDSGIGIHEADIEKLFNAYSQLEASASRRVGGTGLGLTVTKHLVEKHGGSLQVNSLVGLGSQFIIRLPLDLHELAQHELAQHELGRPELGRPELPGSQPIPRNINLAGLTILIADDDAVNCIILRNQLSQSHGILLETHNGKEAWDVLNQQNKIDIVLLDLHMPHLGGFEVAKLMRNHERWAQTPILFLTASIQDADREETKNLSPAFIDLKPIRKEDLLEKINILCSRNILKLPLQQGKP